jgi:hypothetical protein
MQAEDDFGVHRRKLSYGPQVDDQGLMSVEERCSVVITGTPFQLPLHHCAIVMERACESNVNPMYLSCYKLKGKKQGKNPNSKLDIELCICTFHQTYTWFKLRLVQPVVRARVPIRKTLPWHHQMFRLQSPLPRFPAVQCLPLALTDKDIRIQKRPSTAFSKT